MRYRDIFGKTALERLFLDSEADARTKLETAIVLIRAGADGPRALELARRDVDTLLELVKALHEAGAPKPFQFALEDDYSEIAEYLKDWNGSDHPIPAD